MKYQRAMMQKVSLPFLFSNIAEREEKRTIERWKQ